MKHVKDYSQVNDNIGENYEHSEPESDGHIDDCPNIEEIIAEQIWSDSKDFVEFTEKIREQYKDFPMRKILAYWNKFEENL